MASGVQLATYPVWSRIVIALLLALVVHFMHMVSGMGLVQSQWLFTLSLIPVGLSTWAVGARMGLITVGASALLELLSIGPSAWSGELWPRLVAFVVAGAGLCWLCAGQQRANAAIRASQERYRQLAHHFPNGAVLLFDRELRFLLADGQGLTAAGLDAARMKGRTVQESFPQPLAERLAGHCRAALAGQPQMHELEINQRLYQTNAVPVHDAGGRVVGGLVIIQDISERRQLEQQLRQMQKMDALGRLAGGVAHDFNNLLAVILGRCERLGASIDDPKAAQELAAIRQAGERAAALTRQLLAFSRRQAIEPTPIDCSRVIADMEQMLARLVTERIQITTRLDRDLPLVMADRGQLEQVLLNLCVNARDAIAARGQITIETTVVELDRQACERLVGLAPGRHVQIDVRDTGSGMDAQTRSRIFEPFFTTKPTGQGTGLGLAIVFGVVQQCGGHVACDSTLGQGTVFTIHLPVCDSSAVAATATPPTGMPALSGGEAVLLVEDEIHVREMISDFLESRGYRVFSAEHAEAALALLDRQSLPIDVLVSDMVMPGMGGAQLHQRLSQRIPGLRTVLMSGYTEDGQVVGDRLPAGTAFIQKPFALEALNQKIRALLVRHG